MHEEEEASVKHCLKQKVIMFIRIGEVVDDLFKVIKSKSTFVFSSNTSELHAAFQGSLN